MEAPGDDDFDRACDLYGTNKWPDNPTGFDIHPRNDTDALTIRAPDWVYGLMVK